MIANIQTAKRKVSVGINHSSICTRSRPRILSDRPVSKRWTLPKGLSDCGLNYLVVIFFAQMVQNVCKSDGSCLHKLHYPHSAVISAYIRSASSHCGIVLNKAKSLLLVKFYRQHTQSIRTAIILWVVNISSSSLVSKECSCSKREQL